MSASYERFQALNPAAKRNIVLAGVALVIAAVVILVGTSGPERTRKKASLEMSAEKIQTDLLTGNNPRKLGIEAIADDVRGMTKKYDDMAKRLEDLDAERAKDAARHKEEIEKLKNEMASGSTSGDQRANKGSSSSGVNPDIPSRQKNASESEPKFWEKLTGLGTNPVKTTNEAQDPSDFSASPAILSNQNPKFQRKTTTDAPNNSGSAPLSIRVISESSQDGTGKSTPSKSSAASPASKGKDSKEDGDNTKSTESTSKFDSDENTFMLSAGSIISGTLITGMDAPTAMSFKKDPLPALLRVKHEALLPNRFKMDIRECFLVAAGHGDLSTERAQLRAESLSCIRADGTPIEVKLNAWAVGEDGKTGIRGRLVSKQGTVVARALMAGFMSGVSDAYKPQPIATINTSGVGGYVMPDPQNAAQMGASSGISNAMSRLADYYVEMAKDIYPVIEVDAGRKVEFIVQNGVKVSAN